jgi:hypothetical protein
MDTKQNKTIGTYFGLKVELVLQMKHRSLIRFQEREIIVDTADLVCRQTLRRAA